MMLVMCVTYFYLSDKSSKGFLNQSSSSITLIVATDSCCIFYK